MKRYDVQKQFEQAPLKVPIIAPGNTHIQQWWCRMGASENFCFTPTADALRAVVSGGAPLPPAVILVWNTVNPPQTLEAYQVLQELRHKTGVEVPIIVIAANNAIVPVTLKAHAVFSDTLPAATLMNEIIRLSRTSVRSEEAKVRRSLFGSQISQGGRSHQPRSRFVGIIGSAIETDKDRLETACHQLGRTPIWLQTLDGVFALTNGQRAAFDAFFVDADLEDCAPHLTQVGQIYRRRKPPVFAFTNYKASYADLYEAGVPRVLPANLGIKALKGHLRTAFRARQRAQVSDAVLERTSAWLSRADEGRTIPLVTYNKYLEGLEVSTTRRGESVNELHLMDLLRRFSGVNLPAFLPDMNQVEGAILSLAMAVCRDEDFVANVEKLGPVAVLRSPLGKQQLTQRINTLIKTTGIASI
ncbi:hypothetical protein [Polycladidibacter hongkongensis]|uniref:hypothetical protein n=1 Tax=Polycladidibacter hongkongensis TaxID=1647556 RepID=UPI00082B1B77|nr:hypothetical protein [Pseudovibrio hongkongensis]